MAEIHPTAIVSPSAELGNEVSVGPYAIVEAQARVGHRCTLAARVIIKSGTTLGDDNMIAEGAILGGVPQHLRLQGTPGKLRIGHGNCIRENVTIHRGLGAEDTTLIGNKNLLMVGSHVAHDCVIGNQTIIANNAMLAGHITVGDQAYISGAVGIHQFCRIGRLAMLGGQAHITQDVPPFVTVDGKSSHVVGLNLIGLRRAGIASAEVRELKATYRLLYRGGTAWSETLANLEKHSSTSVSRELLDFVSHTKRGIVQERRGPRLATVPYRKQETHQPAPQRKAG